VLEKERDQVDMERVSLEKKKSEAEQPEREAKERHEKAWEGEWIGWMGGGKSGISLSGWS